MVKYYWYITINPESTASAYSGVSGSNIKRSITPPNNLFYISETIDGYNHTIKGKTNDTPSTKMNDSGDPSMISTINKYIIDRLKSQWTKQNTEYISRKSEEASKARESSYKSDMEREMSGRSQPRFGNISGLFSGRSDYELPLPYEYEEDPYETALMQMRKKKIKRLSKVNINRKGACKCTKTVRRVKRK